MKVAIRDAGLCPTAARSLYYSIGMRGAKKRGTTLQQHSVSDVIRDAVKVLVDQPAKDRPYDDMADLIGSVSGLPADLSERTAFLPPER